MTFKISLHNHSHYSDKVEQTTGRQPYNQACRRATPISIVENAMEHGLDEVAITDSNADLFFQEMCEKGDNFFDRKYNVKVAKPEEFL